MGNDAAYMTLKIIALITFYLVLIIAVSTVPMSATNSAPSNEIIPVVIVFKEQPAHDISIKTKNEYKKQFEDITMPAKKIYSRIKPHLISKKGNNVQELITLEQSLLAEDEKILLNETGHKLESKTRDMRKEILNKTTFPVDRIQAPIIDKIKLKGGRIKYSSKIFNAISADIPISYINELSREQSIHKISRDYLINASLDISTPAMGTNTLWENGYTGGVQDAAIVDTGIDGTHPALNVDYASVFHEAGKLDPLYHDNQSKTDDLQGHGTHVAGIVASNDSTYKGAAYGIDKLINAKAGWLDIYGRGLMYLSDSMAAIDWAIFGNPDDADVISLSFGGGVSDGDSEWEHFFDAIVYDLDIPAVIAAGNSGPGGSTVGYPAGAFNVIAVGNVNDMNTVSRTDDVLASSSSRGPTLDGRIKPDISAPGTGIMSANNKWETQDDFISLSGTSMATPHITGSILLILDYKNFRWRPEAIKALILNTAEDKGNAGPDYDYGFGYVDLTNAYIHRDDVITDSINDAPDGHVEKYYRGNISTGEKATLVWNRHINYSGPDYPTNVSTISNLDLYLYNETSGAAAASSVSDLNNVEQVTSNANYSSAILKVEPDGTFPEGVIIEDYALSTESGFEQTNPPNLTLNITIPDIVDSGWDFELNVTVNNTGDMSAHNVNVTLILIPGFTVSGPDTLPLGTIDPGNSASANWTVRALNTTVTTSYDLEAAVNSSSYGEYFLKNGTNSITVLSMPPRVEGFVYHGGTGIAGATVTANTSESTTANESGFYSLQLLSGDYMLTALSEPGYYPNNSVNLTVMSGVNVVQDIELIKKPTGNVTGSVTNT